MKLLDAIQAVDRIPTNVAPLKLEDVAQSLGIKFDYLTSDQGFTAYWFVKHCYLNPTGTTIVCYGDVILCTVAIGNVENHVEWASRGAVNTAYNVFRNRIGILPTPELDFIDFDEEM